ncbi:site-specific DNA-methyltransferase [Methylobacterium planeticum]|uniref:site-specific DNA-methyltransferase (adenine-specific) n=1 Tax=Methylobacterium planeticum TaxID=2615211 RepID=A0A6N6MKS2_9HYPH|nr:site-specific DNA-methyltransferase [Methylobacterium planeticum]KAB1070587.1 site-specific DNA-methyltransferase [Methylobacterium planeticum]
MPEIKKIDLNDPDTKSADIVAGNIDALKVLFPEAFTEGKIDFEVLKGLLGAAVDERDEKYGLNWHGKRRARQIALTPSTGTLLPCPDESVDWDTTQNLMIEGDNLEVLKLLQKSYAGKVKLIYIDPPYNTGKDFVYPDDFRDNIKNYLELTGQIEGERKISSNTESSGRFHTEWLNMMLPRLKLSRDLLTDDGVLIVSIDEAEHANLIKTCELVFGEENFAGEIIWRNSSKNDQSYISIQHEYFVVFVKNKQSNPGLWMEKKSGLEEIYAAFLQFKAKHGNDWGAINAEAKAWFKQFSESNPISNSKHYTWMDEAGIYFPDNISGPNFGQYRYDVLHPVTGRVCKEPASGWRYPEETMKKRIADGRVHFGADHSTVPNNKTYLKDTEFQSLTSMRFVDGRAASKRLQTLFGTKVFTNPKDEFLLKDLMKAFGIGADHLVLDFFAGSGTTQHAIFELNAEQGSQVRAVLVQFPEKLDGMLEKATGSAKEVVKNAIAYLDAKGVPRTIFEIAKERVRLAARAIPGTLDRGFRVFKLASSNIRAWEPDAADLANSLLKNAEHLVQGRKEQDVLYELLLKLGLDLCVPIEAKTIAGKSAHSIGGGALIVCLADGLTKDVIEPLASGIVAWRVALAPAVDTRVVFKDSGFADDIAKTNMAAILNQNGITDVRSL